MTIMNIDHQPSPTAEVVCQDIPHSVIFQVLSIHLQNDFYHTLSITQSFLQPLTSSFRI